MTNALKRSGHAYSIPATPYIPFRPAYTYVEPVMGYTRPDGWTMDVGSAYTAPSGGAGSGPGTLLPDGTWLPAGYNVVVKGVSPPGAGVTVPAGGSQPSYGIVGYRFITVPEQPEQRGSPGRRVSEPPSGWNSFGRSLRGITAGTAKFTVPPGVSGVVAGLAEFSKPNAGYGHIRHGLRFAGNRVYNARTGADLGEFIDEDEFEVVYDGAKVVFMRNGDDLDAEPATYRREPLYLSAAMHDVGDMVDNPSLVDVGFGISKNLLPTLTVLSSDTARGEAIAMLPALVVDAGSGNFGFASLPALTSLAASGAYGAVKASIPALTSTSYGGMVPGVGSSGADVSLPMLVSVAIGQGGGMAQASATLPAMTVLAGDAAYGQGKASLPALTSFVWGEPNDEGYALETLASSTTAAGAATLLVTVLEHVTLGSTAVPSTLLDAAINEIISAAPSVAVEQLLEVVARTFIQAGSTGVLEGATGRTDQDTWVWHADAKGSTVYRSYPFNSFAVIDGKHYGASSDGLFLLEGEDDAGTPVHASFDLGKMDFGSASQKTIAECYVGMSASGNLFLKLIAEGREFVYKTRGFSEHMQQQRITPGKGLKSNYITVQFFNEDGANFEIDTVNFLVADLQRKI
ncbi:hypothetical protein [Variovorax boronicumulans]|uniref:hypothetical protein n=1 Tax=Variovorax boronicumulans TaxID=436515 RepID=UPI0012E553AC|nr:hypothetical protein [Variovorax boronicumulans]GER16676.1 hypothetical protein VCH24_16820 [Variovorax boronicumulans]